MNNYMNEILKNINECLSADNNICAYESIAYNIINIMVVLYILAFLTSPLGVIQLLFIICKLPYHLLKVVVGWMLPSLLAKNEIFDTLAIQFPAELGDINVTFTQSNNYELHKGDVWQL